VNRTHQDNTSPDLSRRSLLQSAAGAGLAATAVTALGAAASVTSAVAASPAPASPAAANSGSSTDATAPLVVHVRDVKSGDIEVFSGTSQTRVRDRALAARIAQAIS
jgi:nitrous oxide reductase